ncbi:thiamine transport system permease protein [Halomicrobium zhouii]|uniref:Thiamine transport system permease protein n=1 Tax=Halomicrobium zhouii TaxID=767519 RepID=A0A1I6LT95_9EURY|nr:iron ABC transporter permease [Halomicrobium zhouii]SFS06648.1 thiamine transport system permease protein [Halomicrobium zhouii]
MRERAERFAVPLGLTATVAVLVVVFYYPVGSVLADAVFGDGQPTLAPILDVLEDPFYTGAGHHLFTDPLGIPAGILQWILAIEFYWSAVDVGIVELYRPIVDLPPTSIGLFGFTAYQAALSTVASVALGLPGAYLLSRYEFPGRRTIRSLTILPFVLPGIMVAVGFLAMFGRNGLFNDLLAVVGLGPVEALFTLEIVIVAHAFYNAPLVTRLVTTAWESVDRRQVETARSMGATPFRAFRDVVVPQLLPSLLTASLLTFVFTFMTFPIVLALGGLQLATVEVWLYARVQNLELTEAAALGTIETVISLGLTYLYLRYEARQVATRSAGTPLARRPLLDGVRSLRDPRRLALAGYGVVVLVVFVGPLLSMVVESVTGPGGQFTLEYYRFLLAQQTSAAIGTTRPLPAIVNSLLFGVGTLALALPMGIVVAVVANRNVSGSRAAEAVLSAPLAVSGIVVGLGLLQTLVFGTVLFDYRITVLGPIAIVFAHAVAAYPFVTRNVAPALGGLDPRLVDAARSLGASRFRSLVDIELPLVASGVVAGAAFAFAISVGEFDSTVLLAEGVDSYTMPVALERYIGNRSLGPSLGAATAMGTVLLAVTAGSFVVIDRVGGRWQP